MLPHQPPPVTNPVWAAWNTVTQFEDYEAAQRAVDQLSDDGFPVEKLDIIGSDLRLVERVTGRLTKTRAAGAGALSGLWVGLLIGILLSLFTSANAWFGVLLTGIGLGVAFGAIFGFAAHALTRGRRDFSSVRALAANRYDLIARDGTADRARTMLADTGSLPGARSRTTPLGGFGDRPPDSRVDARIHITAQGPGRGWIRGSTWTRPRPGPRITTPDWRSGAGVLPGSRFAIKVGLTARHAVL